MLGGNQEIKKNTKKYKIKKNTKQNKTKQITIIKNWQFEVSFNINNTLSLSKTKTGLDKLTLAECKQIDWLIGV